MISGLLEYFKKRRRASQAQKWVREHTPTPRPPAYQGPVRVRANASYGHAYPDMGWCHGCRKEIPLLSAEEAEELRNLWRNDRLSFGIQKSADYDTKEAFLRELFRRSLKWYQTHKGVEFVTEDELRSFDHWACCHSIDDFGLPCPNCGKLLRTRRATYCVECGYIPDTGDFVRPEEK